MVMLAVEVLCCCCWSDDNVSGGYGDDEGDCDG